MFKFSSFLYISIAFFNFLSLPPFPLPFPPASHFRFLSTSLFAVLPPSQLTYSTLHSLSEASPLNKIKKKPRKICMTGKFRFKVPGTSRIIKKRQHNNKINLKTRKKLIILIPQWSLRLSRSRMWVCIACSCVYLCLSTHYFRRSL